MGSWRLKRQVDFGEELIYKFTPKFVLKAGQSVTVRTPRGRCILRPSLCPTSHLLSWSSMEKQSLSDADPPHSHLQVWAADAGVAHSPPTDLLLKMQASWGSGSHMVTTLINGDGEVSPSVHSFSEGLKAPVLGLM